MSSTSQSNVVNDSVGADSVGTGTGASASSQQQQQPSGANASEQQQPIATGPAADLFQSVDELSQEPPGQHGSGAQAPKKSRSVPMNVTGARSKRGLTSASPGRSSDAETSPKRPPSRPPSQTRAAGSMPSLPTTPDGVAGLFSADDDDSSWASRIVLIENRLMADEAALNSRLELIESRLMTLQEQSTAPAELETKVVQLIQPIITEHQSMASKIIQLEDSNNSLLQQFDALSQLVTEFQQRPQPQRYDVGTPEIHVPPGIPPVQAPSVQAFPSCGPAEAPRAYTPESAMPSAGHPTSCGGYASQPTAQPAEQPTASSRFAGQPPLNFAADAGMYSTQRTASAVTLNDLFNQTAQPPQQPRPPTASPGDWDHKAPVPSEFGMGKSIRKEVNFSINKKDTDALYKFQGAINDFPDWKKRMVDHFADSTQKYRALIDQIGKAKLPITGDALKATQVDGFNAWEIAMELESFTMKWVSKDIYDNRSSLCGGEDSNGFELWRNLHVQYSGMDSMAVQVGGFKNFLKYPQCPSEAGLMNHFAEWEKALNKYGRQYLSDPETLRLMLIATLPKALESKCLEKPHKFPTWQSIVAYVKQKTEGSRQQAIADAIHSKAQRSHRPLHALSEKKSEDEAGSRVPTPVTPVAPTMEDLTQMMVNAFQRQGKGEGKGRQPPHLKGGKGNKFIFKGCFECGADDHSRAACPEWLKILDVSGSPPPGHKGKKDRAYETWKRNKAAKAAGGKGGGKGGDRAKNDKVNALGVEADADDTASEDDDDESSEYEEDPLRVFALHQIIVEPMSPADQSPTIVEDSANSDNTDLAIQGMQAFAHHIRKGKKLSQKTLSKRRGRTTTAPQVRPSVSPVVISSMAELDRQDIISALPKSKKALARLAKHFPRDEPLAENEQWVMADTGSTVNAMRVSKSLPKYQHLVRPCDQPGAECANGETVEIDGELELAGFIDGVLHVVPFKDMNVTMPIASMRQTIKKGNDLRITQEGGTITHRKTGKVIRLHERQGVYFFKMRMLSPHKQVQYQSKPSGFARPV